MTKRWLLLITLFVLTVNAALIATLLVKNNTKTSEQISAKEIDKQKREKNCSHFEAYLTLELKLDTSQQALVKVFSQNFHKNKKQIDQKTRGFKKQYFNELSQPSPDTLFLNDIAQKIGGLAADKMKLEYVHYRNIRSVCNAEQAVKMDSIGRMHMRRKHINKVSDVLAPNTSE
jgi:hypothetical protein